MYELSQTSYNIPIKVTYYKHNQYNDSDSDSDSDSDNEIANNNLIDITTNVKHIEYIYDINDININNDYIIIDGSNKPYNDLNKETDYLSDIYLPYNRLITIPSILPDNLRELYLDNNNIEILENLPRNLIILSIAGNNIDSIKSLPERLEHLNLEKNDITNLPENLPQSLTYLNVNYNVISKLPSALPPKLEFLSIISNNISLLPELPKTLINLHIDFNHIKDSDIDLRVLPNLIYYSNVSSLNDI